MAVGCGMKCIKFTIFFFNFLFLLIGTALIIAGAYVMVAFKDYLGFIPGAKMAPISLIVLGAFIFIPAFCGCCGAVRESRCMLITYAVLMSILLLIEVIIAIVGFVYGTKVRVIVELSMATSVDKYQTEADVQVMWDIVHMAFDCCGANGPDDWRGKLGANSTSVPPTCCLNAALIDMSNTTQCNPNDVLKLSETQRKTRINTKGCINNIESLIKSFIYIICGVAIAIAVIELLGIILAACLANAARSDE